MNRTQSRENAFLLLFETAFHEQPDRDEILKLAAETKELEVNEFVLNLFNGVLDKKEELDNEIKLYCTKRTLERISKVVLTALRIAFYEIKNSEDVGNAVAINEAINLVKKYDTQESAAYANGVLGSYVRKE